MEYEYSWHFEISKEAGLASDEHGNPSNCYSKISMSFKEEKSPEDIQDMEEKVRRYLSKTSEIPYEWLKPISKEEYDYQNEENEVTV